MSASTAATQDRWAEATQLQLTWWRFRKHRLAVVSLVIVVLFYMVAAFADFLAINDPHATDARRSFIPPQAIHLFDANGFTPRGYGRRGVRSNNVAPTVVRTEMTDAFWDADFFQRTNQELTPANRDCTVQDVANMVTFLCSVEAGFVNGQTIAVDGGISATRYLAPEAVGAERK